MNIDPTYTDADIQLFEAVDAAEKAEAAYYRLFDIADATYSNAPTQDEAETWPIFPPEPAEPL